MYCPSGAALLRLQRGKRTAVPMTRLRSDQKSYVESSIRHLMACQAFFSLGESHSREPDRSS